MLKNNAGDHLISHTLSRAVPSAQLHAILSSLVGAAGFTLRFVCYMPSRPIISVTIWARDDQACEDALYILKDLAIHRGGVSLTVTTDKHELTLGAMSESSLEGLCRILCAGKLNLEIDSPKVVFVETIRGAAEAEATYIRQMSSKSDYAHLKLRLEPQEWGTGYQFVNRTEDGVIPKHYISAIEAGIGTARLNGVAGHEMVDFKATLYDGSYHHTDSNETAFGIAAAMAYKEAASKAGLVLLEPTMALEVTTSNDYVDSIVVDLKQRRAQIQTAEHGLTRANVPLVEVLGYARDLETASNGLAESSIRFAHYAEYRGEQAEGDEGLTPANRPQKPAPKHGSTHAKPELD